jgi:hypothetical protein
VPGYVDVCAELFDEALHNGHVTLLSCHKHRRKSMSISFIDVCAKLFDQALHSSHLPFLGCHAQGRVVLEMYFNIGAELFDKIPHGFNKPRLVSN